MENSFQGKSIIDYRFFIITTGILISIFVFIIAARIAMDSDEDQTESIMGISNTSKIPDGKGLNESEQLILALLTRSNGGLEPAFGEEEHTEYDYYNYLKDYFTYSECMLSASELRQLEELIQERDEIFRLEQEKVVSKMSLDARELIIYIEERIYELCGLTITFTVDSQIERIEEHTGNIIYQLSVSPQQSTFHMDIFIIVLLSILVLLGICVAVARKNQLFIKEVKYGGFDEKEYA